MEILGIDISNLLVNNADIVEQSIEYLIIMYIGGNILPNNFVKKVTEHFPLSDIIKEYFKTKEEK